MLAENTQLLSVTRYHMSTPNKGLGIRGQLVTMGLKADTPIKMEFSLYLSYYKEYQKIQGCPASFKELQANGFTDKEIEIAWLSFKKYAKNNLSENTFKFSKDTTMAYNINNGLIAIYTLDHIEVAKASSVWEDTLMILGYTRKENLPVPFSSKEAYYDRAADKLLAIW